LPIREFNAFVSKWVGVKFIAKLVVKGKGVVFFKPLLEDGDGVIQAFGIIRHGDRRQISLVPESLIGSIVTSSYAADYIRKMELIDNE